MTYALELPGRLKEQGWKVKIRDRERVEPPHVSIIRKTTTWRYDIRDPGFLDRDPNPGDVAEEVVEEIHAHLGTLRAEWDARYPHNPIKGE